MAHERPVRALGLCSGGLDSILAALVLRRQGIDVAWVSFETPFFSSAKARAAARETGIPLTVRDITAVYLEMLKNPRCGYGKHMNPCMDCHALMFRLAGEMLAAGGFSFLFSGEVLGQRPMSQTRPSLRYVEKNSGWEGWVVRPLSARRLPETLAEQQGLVDRAQLLDLAGRGRKPQIALASELGVRHYPAPAGGCLLTERGYSLRLRDLLRHDAAPDANALHLLRHGRHFRLPEGVKVIVGRTQADNEEIGRYAVPQRDILLNVERHPGPTVLVPSPAGAAGIETAAALAVAYSRAPRGTAVAVVIEQGDTRRLINAIVLDPAAFKSFIL